MQHVSEEARGSVQRMERERVAEVLPNRVVVVFAEYICFQFASPLPAASRRRPLPRPGALSASSFGRCGGRRGCLPPLSVMLDILHPDGRMLNAGCPGVI